MTVPESAPRYRSTRAPKGRPVSFREALLNGLAPDGGLYNPVRIPPLQPESLRTAASVPELAVALLRPWLVPDISELRLASILTDALSFAVPLVPLQGPSWADVYVLELFHGPTYSFKDFGARTMARLMAHFQQEAADPLTVLVATSGDTGSAVADGFAGQPGIRVVLLYPEGKVSPTQELQLIVRREGVQAFSVRGAFDDCQRMVKAAFTPEAGRAYRLSSANSINIGRLLPQMVYYAWAGRELGAERPWFCVPSGNLGNLTAGMMATRAGLPVRGFIAAHNANDFFPRYLAGADPGFAPSVQTLSTAMDVGAPSNFERLAGLYTAAELRSLVRGVSVDDADTLAAMRRVYADTGYVADPHTAVGLEAVWRLRKEGGAGGPVVVLATAHPAKFPEIVEEALDLRPEPPDGLARLAGAPTRVQSLAPDLDALRPYLDLEGTQVPDGA